MLLVIGKMIEGKGAITRVDECERLVDILYDEERANLIRRRPSQTTPHGIDIDLDWDNR